MIRNTLDIVIPTLIANSILWNGNVASLPHFETGVNSVSGMHIVCHHEHDDAPSNKESEKQLEEHNDQRREWVMWSVGSPSPFLVVYSTSDSRNFVFESVSNRSNVLYAFDVSLELIYSLHGGGEVCVEV